MTRQSVSKHLDVLEEADLVASLRRGREKLHYLNAAPINDIADRWIHHYDRARAEALSDLKTALEATPMDKNSDQTTFVYTTYINATPERVWQGLTEPAFTSVTGGTGHGGVSYRSDWQKGSTYDVAYEEVGLVVSDPAAGHPRVRPLPPSRLHLAHVHAGMGHRTRQDRARRCRLAGRARSKVAFDIEEAGKGVVKLTVVHDGFAPGSASSRGPRRMAGGHRQPEDLLETGTALPARHQARPPGDRPSCDRARRPSSCSDLPDDGGVTGSAPGGGSGRLRIQRHAEALGVEGQGPAALAGVEAELARS